jgi:hypothetical protein
VTDCILFSDAVAQAFRMIPYRFHETVHEFRVAGKPSSKEAVIGIQRQRVVTIPLAEASIEF